jgi:hypothetical protein
LGACIRSIVWQTIFRMTHSLLYLKPKLKKQPKVLPGKMLAKKLTMSYSLSKTNEQGFRPSPSGNKQGEGFILFKSFIKRIEQRREPKYWQQIAAGDAVTAKNTFIYNLYFFFHSYLYTIIVRQLGQHITVHSF